jgi:hypothetical protein
MPNGGMNGMQQDLVDEIMAVLKAKQGMEYARIEMDIPDEDGNMKTEKMPLAGEEGVVSYKTMMNIKTGGGVSGDGVTGTEAMVGVIVDKTINFIMENFEVAWHDRMETLETDFNTFASMILTAGTTLSAAVTMPPGGCAGAGAAFIAAAAAVKGPGRSGASGALKGKEAGQTMGTSIL